MRAEERELAAEQLSQIASEVGLELSPERLERVVGRLESTVEGVRAAAALDPSDIAPSQGSDPCDEQRP